MALDTSLVAMLDDIDLTVEDRFIAEAKAVAGYVNGRFANWPAIVQKYEPRGMHLVSIDVAGNPAAGAQCLDIETQDATIAMAPGWFKATRAAGVQTRDLRWFPKLYTSAGNVAALNAAMQAAGIPRSAYLVWSAHYTQKAHICAPSVCGFPEADATQWTSTEHGAPLDASLCYGYFFAGPGGEIATHAPMPSVPKVSVEASYRGATVLWAPVPGATSYDVQLIGPDGSEAGRMNAGVTKASFAVQPSTDYKVRIAALPGGDWSQAFPFTSADAPLPPLPAYDIRVLDKAATLPLPAGSIVIVPKGAAQ